MIAWNRGIWMCIFFNCSTISNISSSWDIDFSLFSLCEKGGFTEVWLLVLLGTSVGGLVFSNVASRSGVVGMSTTSMIMRYSIVGRVVPNLKW